MTVFPSNQIHVQIFTTGAGFILGESLLGGPDALGGDTTPYWREILCDAQSVQISRGGDLDGVTTTLDVGTLSIRLLESLDPTVDSGVRPNVPIRVFSLIGGVTRHMFRGNIEDISNGYDRDGTVRTTITAADAIRPIAATQRYGAVTSWTGNVGMEFWANRVRRLVDSLDPSVETVLPAARGLASEVTYESADFTGTDYQGWTRFGTRPAGLAADQIATNNGWLEARTAEMAPTVVVTYVPRIFGMRRTITGLIVGRLYSVQVYLFHSYPGGAPFQMSEEYRTFVLGVAGSGSAAGWGQPTVVFPPKGDGTSGGGTTLRYSFVATATSHIIQVARDYDGALGGDSTARSNWRDTYWLRGAKVFRWDEVPLVDVNYESSLQSHLQMACDSAGASWWVDSTNRLNLVSALAVPAVAAEFSDVHSASSSHVCFLDVEAGYDTRNVVTALTMKNHARRPDNKERSNFLVEDLDFTYVDTPARAEWGARFDEIDTCLPYPAIAGRADQLLIDNSTPDVFVQSVTFDALEFPVAAALDLYSRVSVTLRGSTAIYRIIGIEHDGEPDSWRTTFTLRKD